VMAAKAIVNGIKVDEAFFLLDAPAISDQIQGNPFSRQDIANRVVCHINNRVLQEKTAWLKEFIYQQPEEWVFRLLSTVTGERAVTAHTVIKISAARSGLYCVAHTCFKSLDVPLQHVDTGSDVPLDGSVLSNKQKFFNNLTMTMNQEGYDTA